MKPIKFDQANTVFAKTQDEYLNLPAHRASDGCVTTCWGLSLAERLKVLFTGRIWLMTLTFDKPIQPQLLSAYNQLEASQD